MRMKIVAYVLWQSYRKVVIIWRWFTYWFYA